MNILFLLPIKRQTLHKTSVPPVQCVNRGFSPIKCIVLFHIRRAVNEYDKIFVMWLNKSLFDPRLNQGAERVVEIQNVEKDHRFGMKADLRPTNHFENLRSSGEISVAGIFWP